MWSEAQDVETEPLHNRTRFQKILNKAHNSFFFYLKQFPTFRLISIFNVFCISFFFFFFLFYRLYRCPYVCQFLNKLNGSSNFCTIRLKRSFSTFDFRSYLKVLITNLKNSFYKYESIKLFYLKIISPFISFSTSFIRCVCFFKNSVESNKKEKDRMKISKFYCFL